MVLGSTQPLTEMSTRKLLGVKGDRPVRTADSLTAVCEPIVYIMWDPQRLTTLWASMAWYRDSFTFTSQKTLCNDNVISLRLGYIAQNDRINEHWIGTNVREKVVQGISDNYRLYRALIL
jgi:hypothetical protein